MSNAPLKPDFTQALILAEHYLLWQNDETILHRPEEADVNLAQAYIAQYAEVERLLSKNAILTEALNSAMVLGDSNVRKVITDILREGIGEPTESEGNGKH